MISFESSEKYNVYDLVRLIRILRSPEGCPWDREQTHESIKRNFIEEAYEVAEAIEERNPDHLCEELGDVLTQVVFHSVIEEEKDRFDVDDVADAVVRKLIYRHPHVFADEKADSSDQVLENWEDIKKKERGQKSAAEGLVAVAKSLPATWRAEKVQKRAAAVGFDWPDIEGALLKLQEEVDELRSALLEKDRGQALSELGDVFFSAVNVSRFLKTDPEEALDNTTDRFIERFSKMEELIIQSGGNLEDLTLDELDKWYVKAKTML